MWHVPLGVQPVTRNGALRRDMYLIMCFTETRMTNRASTSYDAAKRPSGSVFLADKVASRARCGFTDHIADLATIPWTHVVC